MTTTRRNLVIVGVVGLAVGLPMAPLLFAPGPIVQADGGVVYPPTYTLDSGESWPFPPDSGNMPLDCSPGASSCTVATGTGYVQLALAWDGGPVFPSAIPQAYSCGCAPLDGGCLFTDGGPVPLTGSYPWAQLAGAPCLRRPCAELAGWTGAPQGCIP